MSFVIAVIGSVASGKSSALRFFETKNISVISADEINRSLLEPETPLFSEIVKHFGNKIVDERGRLNKQDIRNIIFSNFKEKQWMENLLHPIIREKMLYQVNQSVGPYVVVEIPLLKSKKDYPFVDRILLISVDKKTQVKRIIERDHCSYEQAEALVRNHPTLSERYKLANDIIHNDGSKEKLFEKLSGLHKCYCSLSRSS